MTTSVSNIIRRDATTYGRSRLPVPVEVTWNDVWLTVTPVWAVLAFGKVAYYAVERLRFPADVPPVVADTVQSIVLWPLAVFGCYLMLSTWRRRGFAGAAVVALISMVVFGVLARPAYAVGSLLNSEDVAARQWLDSFYMPLSVHPDAWYPWLSNAVEYGVLYLSCLAATLGLFSFVGLTKERALRAQVEATVDKERLRALRAQVNPHFLFNSLNSIVSLSDANPKTQLLVTQLSDLLRRTLRASESEEHQLFEELTYVEEYLEIEQTRQPSRIDWRIRVEAGCARAAVPSLFLMPLVENSVTHGLRGGARSVSIEIVAWRTRDKLFVCVANTCSESLPTRDVTRPGLGLRNVRTRLAMLFGTTASVSADRADAGRFEVQISLPMRELRPQPFREEPPCAS
jgi:hypothetical protein